MNGVEALGLRLREVHTLHGTDLESRILDALDNPAHHPPFNGVRLDAEVGTLVWPNDADFDPATLHDWPQLIEELATRAQAWAEAASEQRANKGMEPSRR